MDMATELEPDRNEREPGRNNAIIPITMTMTLSRHQPYRSDWHLQQEFERTVFLVLRYSPDRDERQKKGGGEIKGAQCGDKDSLERDHAARKLRVLNCRSACLTVKIDCLDEAISCNKGENEHGAQKARPERTF